MLHYSEEAIKKNTSKQKGSKGKSVFVGQIYMNKQIKLKSPRENKYIAFTNQFPERKLSEEKNVSTFILTHILVVNYNGENLHLSGPPL